MLNEAAAKALGYQEATKLVNQNVNWAKGMYEHGGQQTKVVGIVKNHYQQSLKENPQPLIYMPRKFYNPVWTNQYYLLRFNSGDEQKTIQLVKEQWTKQFAGDPFNYFFLEDYFNQYYDVEQKFAHMFSTFTLLAILIAAMGLYGLSSFTIMKRSREVALRKVLGASDLSIFTLLGADYFKLLLIAYVISIPTGYYLILAWLENYQHRITIGLWYFIFPAAIVILIAISSIAYRIIRASIEAPIQALKSA